MKDFSIAPESVLYVCCGSKCKKNGGKHIYKSLKHELKHLHLKGKLQVIKTGCTDRCKMGPVMAIMPENEWHLQVTEERSRAFLDSRVTRLRKP